MRSILRLLPVLIGLAGCAQAQPVRSPEIRYINNKATQEQLLRDRYACLQETQQRDSGAAVSGAYGAAFSQVMPNCGAFNACLAARGYILSPNGNLVVPPGAGIQCRDY
jgi:hypothetical protein